MTGDTAVDVGLSGGAITGIALACIALAALCFLAVLSCTGYGAHTVAGRRLRTAVSGREEGAASTAQGGPATPDPAEPQLHGPDQLHQLQDDHGSAVGGDSREPFLPEPQQERGDAATFADEGCVPPGDGASAGIELKMGESDDEDAALAAFKTPLAHGGPAGHDDHQRLDDRTVRHAEDPEPVAENVMSQPIGKLIPVRPGRP